jgi:galactose mutarotase-like enzyme
MTVQAIRGPNGGNILWERPVAQRSSALPGRVGTPGHASIATFHDSLTGGWFELSPHAGLPGLLNGKQTMLHGEAARLPWRVTGLRRDSVTAYANCTQSSLRLDRTITVAHNSVCVHSTITNLGTAPEGITHGEHPNFDRMFFAGAEIHLAARAAEVLAPLDPSNARLAPGVFEWPFARLRNGGVEDVSRVPMRADGSHDHIAVELDAGAIRIVKGGWGTATVAVDLREHPYLLYWRNFRATGAPGFSDWDVFALEPQSSPGRSVEDAVRASAVTLVSPHARLAYHSKLTID